MTSSVLNEFYFYRGYAYMHDFGEEFSDCAVTVNAEWFPADTIDAKPKIQIIDHYIIIYSGIYDHTGYVENTGPGVLRLQITNHCPCGNIDCVYENVIIIPTIVEDKDLSFPRESGFIQMARIETCSCECISWIVTSSETVNPEFITSYNHLIVLSGLDLTKDGSVSFIDYVPENNLTIMPVQSSPCVTIQSSEGE